MGGCTPRSTARRQPRFACHVGCIRALPVFTAGNGRLIARAADRNGAATLKRARRGAAGLQWETTAIPGFRFAVGSGAPRLTAEGGRPLARAAGRNDAATAKNNWNHSARAKCAVARPAARRGASRVLPPTWVELGPYRFSPRGTAAPSQEQPAETTLVLFFTARAQDRNMRFSSLRARRTKADFSVLHARSG